MLYVVRKVAGATILAVVFGGVFALACYVAGFVGALFTVGLTAILVGTVSLACWLLFG